MKDSHKVTVCAVCHMASCWHGEFLCGAAKMAGTVNLTVAFLRKLDREHPSNWGSAKMAEVYGQGSSHHHQAMMAEREEGP